MSVSNRELWACAALLDRQHAAAAPRKIAERIGALVLAGDEEGVAIWLEIARRLDALRKQSAPKDPATIS